MNVCFLHVGEDLTLPALMVASVHHWMPTARVIQMTDEKTKPVPGVGTLWRIPWSGKKLMTYRLLHLAGLGDEPTLILDTDVIVQADLEGTAKRDFDVALTKRDGRIMWGGKDIVKMMPYNTGVMFSRCGAFWQECAESCARSPDALQEWWGDQVSVHIAASSGRYKVLELPCERFNYSPKSADEDLSEKYAIHFKGERKNWMIAHGSRYLRQS